MLPSEFTALPLLTLLLDVMDTFGRPVDLNGILTKQLLADAGLVGIREEVIRLPLNGWLARHMVESSAGGPTLASINHGAGSQWADLAWCVGAMRAGSKIKPWIMLVTARSAHKSVIPSVYNTRPTRFRDGGDLIPYFSHHSSSLMLPIISIHTKEAWRCRTSS